MRAAPDLADDLAQPVVHVPDGAQQLPEFVRATAVQLHRQVTTGDALGGQQRLLQRPGNLASDKPGDQSAQQQGQRGNGKQHDLHLMHADGGPRFFGQIQRVDIGLQRRQQRIRPDDRLRTGTGRIQSALAGVDIAVEGAAQVIDRRQVFPWPATVVDLRPHRHQGLAQGLHMLVLGRTLGRIRRQRIGVVGFPRINGLVEQCTKPVDACQRLPVAAQSVQPGQGQRHGQCQQQAETQCQLAAYGQVFQRESATHVDILTLQKNYNIGIVW